jgi:hypothetical protein
MFLPRLKVRDKGGFRLWRLGMDEEDDRLAVGDPASAGSFLRWFLY